MVKNVLLVAGVCALGYGVYSVVKDIHDEKKIAFEVIEIYESGSKAINYLKGKRDDVNKEIEKYKSSSKRYEMNGNNKMTIWV